MKLLHPILRSTRESLADRLHDLSAAALLREHRGRYYVPGFVLESAKQPDRTYEESRCLLEMAEFFWMEGDPVDAEISLCLNSTGDVLTLAHHLKQSDSRITITLGAFHLYQGNIEAALRLFSHVSATESNSLIRSRALANIAAALERLGDKKAAYRYSVRAVSEPLVASLALGNHILLTGVAQPDPP